MFKGIVTVLHILSALGLIAAVLLMSGRSAGLSGAVGGGAERLFGKKRGMDEILGRYAALLAGSFLITAIILAAAHL
ncbi:MAG: preprotein translocase subunit SecG [bacterium]|nr:preprotein translocase subunit SecG [bacterium]